MKKLSKFVFTEIVVNVDNSLCSCCVYIIKINIYFPEENLVSSGWSFKREKEVTVKNWVFPSLPGGSLEIMLTYSDKIKPRSVKKPKEKSSFEARGRLYWDYIIKNKKNWQQTESFLSWSSLEDFLKFCSLLFLFSYLKF